MPFKEILVPVVYFSDLQEGETFILLKEIPQPDKEYPHAHPKVYRKTQTYYNKLHFNAVPEFYEGESCNRGMVIFNDNVEVMIVW